MAGSGGVEEAATRLLLDALHATITGSKVVIITAEYTDVMLFVLVSKIIYPVPSIRRTANVLSKSQSWPGHWECSETHEKGHNLPGDV